MGGDKLEGEIKTGEKGLLVPKTGLGLKFEIYVYIKYIYNVLPLS